MNGRMFLSFRIDWGGMTLLALRLDPSTMLDCGVPSLIAPDELEVCIGGGGEGVDVGGGPLKPGGRELSGRRGWRCDVDCVILGIPHRCKQSSVP